MAKIIDPDLLNVGTELLLDTTANTIELVAAGNLVAKDWVTLQALYSKLVSLWTTNAYNKFKFPMYVIDAKSWQYQFWYNGTEYSDWKPLNDTSRQMLRDGWWSEFNNAWVLQRQYVGIVSLGDVNTWAQLYYIRQAGDAPSNFTFTDEVNEGIQVFGNATNGNFDKRTFFKSYVREYAKKYKSSTLADTGQSSTGAYTVNMLLSNEDDLNIIANDATVAANAPYTSIDIEYFWTNQNRTIGWSSYPFRIIIDGANATAQQIYTKVQYLLRQNSDIDTGAWNVTGKTADELLFFVGDTLYTTLGVYIDNYGGDINKIVFTDQNGIQRTEPYTAQWALNFNSFLTAGGTWYYRMYFTSLPGVTNDYGETWAVTVNNALAAAIQGTITSSTIPFTFAYDTNTQGGRTAWTDAQVTVVAGNPGSAKPVVTTYTITRSTGQNITLTAEQDRAYSNP